MGTLTSCRDERVRAERAAAATSLDAVDASVDEWRAAVKAGRREFEAWLDSRRRRQVAAVRAIASERGTRTSRAASSSPRSARA